MLDYRREEAEGSQDDEAGPETQHAADGVETLVQPGVVETAVEADTRHEGPISDLPAPFPRELGAGVDHGGDRQRKLVDLRLSNGGESRDLAPRYVQSCGLAGSDSLDTPALAKAITGERRDVPVIVGSNIRLRG